MKQYLLGFVASFAASATFASGPVELSHLELDLSYNDVGDNVLDTFFGASDTDWMSIGFNAGLSFGAFLTEVDFQRERISEDGDSFNFDTLTLGLGYRLPAGGVASSFGDTVIFLEYGEMSFSGFGLDVLGFGVNSYNDQFGLGVAYEEVTADGFDEVTSWSVWGEYFIPNTPVTLGLGFTRADVFGEDTDILKLSAAYTFAGSNLTPYIEAKRLDSFGEEETFYNIGIRFTFGPNGAGATSPGNLMVGSDKARATSPFGVKETPIIAFGGIGG